jgi:hypothetical protein
MKFDNRPLRIIIAEHPDAIFIDAKNIELMFQKATDKKRIFYRCFPVYPCDTDIVIRRDQPIDFQELATYVSLKPLIPRNIADRIIRNSDTDDTTTDKIYECVICYQTFRNSSHVTSCCGTVVCPQCNHQLRQMNIYNALKCPGCQTICPNTMVWSDSVEIIEPNSSVISQQLSDINKVLILCDGYRKICLNLE